MRTLVLGAGGPADGLASPVGSQFPGSPLIGEDATSGHNASLWGDKSVGAGDGASPKKSFPSPGSAMQAQFLKSAEAFAKKRSSGSQGDDAQAFETHRGSVRPERSRDQHWSQSRRRR